MRKILNFIIIIFSSIIIAGVYGILHDQITYTISNEYYTLFKFEQFGINEWGIASERVKAGIIGFLATWWVGFFLGIIYAFISLFLNSRKILRITIQSILLNIIVTVVFGVIGYLYGAVFLEAENLNWYIPEQTKHIQAFINVGSVHNFGYLGGLVGLIVGVYNQIKKTQMIDMNHTIEDVICWMDGGTVLLKIRSGKSTFYEVEFVQKISLVLIKNKPLPGSLLLNGNQVELRSDLEKKILSQIKNAEFGTKIIEKEKELLTKIISECIEFVESENYIEVAKKVDRLK